MSESTPSRRPSGRPAPPLPAPSPRSIGEPDAGASAVARTPEALLARYRATGDPAALGGLFDGTAPVLFRIAVSLTHDAIVAEDCVQETYLAALTSLDAYDAARPVMPWLVGILENMVRRARRARTRVPEPLRVAAARAEPPEDAADELGHDEDAQRIRGAIDALSEPYRSVALLRWRYGLSPSEIADVRDEPPGTVRSLLSRALERMRALLKATPALALLPTAPLGLAAVRETVLARGAELGIGLAPTAVAPPVAGISVVAKVLAAAAVLVAIVGGTLALRRSGAAGKVDADGASTVVSEPARGVEPPAGETSAIAVENEPPAAADATARAGEAVARPPIGDDETAVGAVVAPPPGLPRLVAPSGPEAEPGRMEPDPRDAPLLGVDPTDKPAPAAPNVPPGSPGSPDAPVALDDDEDDDGTTGPFGERIEAAVAKGVRWLKSHQLPDGSFGLVEGNAAYAGAAAAGSGYLHPAGSTALALYALLKSGVPVDDPVVKRGFAFLRDRHRLPGGSYETAMLLLAVTATADPAKRTKETDAAGVKARLTGTWREWAQRLHTHLLTKRTRARALGWRYQVEGASIPPGGDEDLSSTQLAALALLAADRCGIRTESAVWNDLITFALRQQEADGPAWPRAVYDRRRKGAKPAADPTGRYAPPAGEKSPLDRARGFAYILSETLPSDEGRPTGSTTACGIGILQIARYVLLQREDRTFTARAPTVQAAIYDGLAWLDAHWSAFANPEKRTLNVYHVYYVYCVERSLDLIGPRLLGRHVWYVEMATELLARQTEKGFWDSASTHRPREVLDTSFALLFLRRSMNGEMRSVTEPGDAPPKDGR